MISPKQKDAAAKPTLRRLVAPYSHKIRQKTDAAGKNFMRSLNPFSATLKHIVAPISRAPID
jgi:hypothetical protein